MQLEDYFDFLAPDDIRIKGSRIGIKSVLYEYIYREQEPNTIKPRFLRSPWSKSMPQFSITFTTKLK